MDIRQAFSGLLGSPHLIALREGGPIVTVTNRGQVLGLRSGRPYRYVGKLSDFLATDWQVVTAAQLQAAAERAGAAAEDES
jgi:hypothetical protein